MRWVFRSDYWRWQGQKSGNYFISNVSERSEDNKPNHLAIIRQDIETGEILDKKIFKRDY